MSARRSAVAAALILAIAIPSVAVAFGEGDFLRLGKRNPSANGTLALTSETEIIADSATYGTRQSNKRDGNGGGAIYGCRSNPRTSRASARATSGRSRVRVRHDR